jgi:hypothetical protein
MNPVRFLLGTALLLSASTLWGQSSVTCSSDDMRRHYCGVDTRDGVRMVRQRSEAACREGYSWGSDRRGIWVDHGCRADFEVGTGGGYGGRGRNDRRGDYRGPNTDNYKSSVISCSSDDMRRHYCNADTRGSRVRVVRQHSEAACRQGYSYGTDRRGLWVDHGCRADFEISR